MLSKKKYCAKKFYGVLKLSPDEFLYVNNSEHTGEYNVVDVIGAYSGRIQC